MQKYIFTLFLFLCSFSIAFSYDDLLFKPLTANQLEARLGAFYEFENDNMRLDIGHSLDLYQFKTKQTEDVLTNINNQAYTVRIGADFFILSRLRSEGRMKFPVETADYFFGINASSKFSAFDMNFSSRLRVAHISSHLMDGYSSDGQFWKEPFVYSREFIDLVLALDMKYIRPYFGCTYIFSTAPNNINKFVPQIGFDFEYKLYKFIDAVGGYDFKLMDANDNSFDVGCNALQAGVLFNVSKNIGISLNYYYSDYNIHGMFYLDQDKYNGFGFQINY